MSKKWFTDSIKQVLAEQCPEGFHPGRLPVSEETRRKHSENSGWKTMTAEVKAARAQKISNTMQNRTEEEKRQYSENMSKARKGKGLGITPWNKGAKGLQVAWNKGTTLTEEAKQHLRDVYQQLPAEEKSRRAQLISAVHKGKIPWNKGLHYTLDSAIIKAAKAKEIATKKERGNFQTSQLEDTFFKDLLKYFDITDIETQYFDSERYPFNCDFYIKPLDLFIEIHGNWTHGYMPFDESNPDCIAQLELWKTKAQESDYYKNAIYTWTDLDVRKVETAHKNNLNHIVLYNSMDTQEFFKMIKEVLND